ncbi:MAG: DUF2336 domain-containing protein [Cohaesibacteraceae bacterium]|nr:DUF2336 domain-containing protein [Cohaesibacteraceae bacterium]
MLNDITELAHEKSSEKRRELLSRVADMFFEGAEHHSQQETVLFRDVVMQMLDEVELDARAEFSARIAPMETIPIEVAKRLGSDDVEVAAPVLRESPLFSDEDIIEMTNNLSSEHLEAIAERKTLSGDVTDALIEKGSREVWHKVTKNQGAEITNKGFASLASKADGDTTLQSHLCNRPDIPEDVAKNLLPLLPEEGKKKLAKLFAGKADKANEFFDAAKNKVIKKRMVQRTQRIEAKVLLSNVEDGMLTLGEAMALLIKDKRASDIVLFFSRLARMEEKVASNTLYQVNSKPVSILCKSFGLHKDVFKALVEMRTEMLHLPPGGVDHIVEEYEALNVPIAQRAMRFVGVRQATKAS